MPYDGMTDEEFKEYEKLYANCPDTAAGRADRYIQLARKGWSGTRAADDCFEMGDGDEVLKQLLKRVHRSPHLKTLFIDQGAWNTDWDEQLEAIEIAASESILKTEFTWAGIKIELTYKPEWSTAFKVSHLELRSIEPEKARLPVTETGYRSHFFHGVDPMSEKDLVEMVTEWLDEKAEDKKWQAYQRESEQLTLF